MNLINYSPIVLWYRYYCQTIAFQLKKISTCAIYYFFQHDSGSVCTPYSAQPSNQNGNFIMFASATSGDRPNNSKFSPCSKDNITLVLDKVLNSQNGKVGNRSCKWISVPLSVSICHRRHTDTKPPAAQLIKRQIVQTDWNIQADQF